MRVRQTLMSNLFCRGESLGFAIRTIDHKCKTLFYVVCLPLHAGLEPLGGAEQSAQQNNCTVFTLAWDIYPLDDVGSKEALREAVRQTL